jgi:UDP-glucose 4-epimerase
VPKIQRVLILGHSGFIGRHLIDTWTQNPDGVEVKGISIPEVDLTQEESQDSIVEAYDDHTAVVLCAAVKRQFGENVSAFQSNVRIVQNLIAAAGKKKISRLAFMSSAAVYGEETHDTAITEETSVNPSSYYGIAKFTGECLLRKALGEGKITSLICFRPPLVRQMGTVRRGGCRWNGKGGQGTLDFAAEEQSGGGAVFCRFDWQSNRFEGAASSHTRSYEEW